MKRYSGSMKLTAALTLPVLLGVTTVAQTASQVPNQQPGQAPVFTISVRSEIVLTNVVARDKQGNVVKDLKASDFTVFENGKPQKISSFDFQNVDLAAALKEKTTVAGTTSIAKMLERSIGEDKQALRDHRLIVIFFDLSSMQQSDIDRGVDSAKEYINKKMAPADLVAVVSMDTSLKLVQDFTADQNALLRAVGSFNGTEGQGFANGGNGDSEGTADDASSFVVDDSEYNALNTDRSMYAILQVAKSLERVDQRKSLLYFSGGLTRNGIENQASLRAATNAATKANMSIYSVDTRGLQALPPVGDASTGSTRGTSAYNGATMQSRLDSNFSSQETLASLSSDTGGKAFFDSNDFGPAFQAIQHDTEAYYIIGFRSTDQRRDGSFRKLQVKINRPDIKLEYRPGYYAPADFQHQKNEDRELALNEQLRSDAPAVDVAVYLQALYFRQNDNHFFVPVSLIVPGSQIPFTQVKDQSKATIDIIGNVKNAQQIVVGSARETVKLQLDANQQVQRKNIQYSTGFSLAPGRYHLKFVVRENQSGNMGSFETDINVPDMKKVPLKLSSVLVANQRTPNNNPRNQSLLVRDGQQYVPNIPHVFRQDQHLYFLYEVYDPAKPASNAGAATPPPTPAGLQRRPDPAAHVLTSIEFLNAAGSKVFETPLIEANAVNIPDRNAVGFQFDVPLAQLAPGSYICQVNVIDDAGGTFTFPRMAMMITAPVAAPAVPAVTPTAAAKPGE
ncbi:VWA domain-containing protein [Terriglobus albidus]|uniref:VWA domain-containing protein n=2 Tax=Terriglobus albidus TaxID=1592106 RepID=A0A5B9EGP1_9BACT|nr:VWA domain-containing protein [Terriglobus albidus]